MLRKFQFGEIVAVTKSGVTGALALAGAFIILIIALTLTSTSLPWTAHIYQESLATCTLSFLLTMVTGTGFILGIILRRRLPVLKKGFAPMVVAAIPMIIGTWFVYQYATRVEFPRKMKLAEDANGTFKFHLKIPSGRYYSMKLFVPGIQHLPNGKAVSTYTFSGHISISNNAGLIADFPLDSSHIPPSSDGFILAGAGVKNSDLPALNKFIQASRDYDIKVSLNPPPPPASSLWLCWQQTYRDRSN
jgi:hypothetical protein